jgi:hypothetical protein
MSSLNTGSSSIGLMSINSIENFALQGTIDMKPSSTSTLLSVQSWYSKRGLDTLGMVVVGGEQVSIDVSKHVLSV